MHTHAAMAGTMTAMTDDALWQRLRHGDEEALREAARLVEGVSTWFTTDDHARDCAADIRALATPPAENGEG